MGDFTGRFMAGYGPWSRGAPKPLSVLAYAVLRIAVAGAIVFCHVVTPTVSVHVSMCRGMVPVASCARAATACRPRRLSLPGAPMLTLTLLHAHRPGALTTDCLITHAPTHLRPHCHTRRRGS